jgi:uncharacterized membrane protein HdeD (DUF308 family)
MYDPFTECDTGNPRVPLVAGINPGNYHPDSRDILPLLSERTLLVLITILGAYWFVSGLFALFSLAIDRTNAGYKILFGILGIIAGLAILAYPLYGTIVVISLFVIFVGVWGLVMGFMSLFAAFKGGG